MKHKSIMKQIISAIFILLTINNAIGATNNSLLSSIKTNTSNIDANLTSYWSTYLTNYLQVSSTAPFLPVTPGLNTELFKALDDARYNQKTSAKEDTQAIVDGSLDGSISISDYVSSEGDFYGIAPKTDEDTASLNDSLNIGSILDKSYISGLDTNDKSTETKISAKNFVVLLSGSTSPPELPQDATDQDLSKLWALNAQQSVLLSNLYHMLRQRERITGLGTTVGMTTANASIVEAEEHLINKRVGNSLWYTEMEGASPVRIERESLYVLAEIHRLLFLTKQQDERILVTLSTLIAQGIDLRQGLGVVGTAVGDAEEVTEEFDNPANDPLQGLPGG